jgi:thiol-disulfide isomerase/thioredoxin
MKWLAIAFVALGCKSDPSPPPASPPEGPHLAFVAAGEGEVDAIVRVETARADGKRVLVYVGATWCEPCRRFHDAAAAGQLDKALPPIRFVEFDLDRDEERLRVAGYESKYVPLFAVPNSDGRASGKQIAGSIKGEGAPAEIAPRLLQLVR